MRVRVLSLAAACAVLALAGCVSATTSSSSATPAPKPAPTDPDLGSVLETYYQQVEDEHWRFAYAMLSSRYKAQLSQDAFTDRYRDIAGLNVTVRQLSDREADATLEGTDADDPGTHIAEVEHVRLAWDGQGWRIDAITRTHP
jgi:hypothetical protein